MTFNIFSIWCNTPIEMFSPLLKTVFELINFDAFWCFCFFVSSLSHWQNISLWGLYSSRETKKITWGEIGWIGRVGHGGHAGFGQKLLSTPCTVGRCTCKSPIVKWANTLKAPSKIFCWSWMQPLTTMPAGTLIQMGSWNIHLVEEACTTRASSSRR